MNQKAHDILFPKFKYYKPKDSHPDWKKLNIEAAELALNIAKNVKLKTNFFQGKIISKRKILAIIKTVKNLFINKRKMAKNDHNFIPIFYIWTMTNNCNFKCTYCSNHRGGVYPFLYNEGYNKDLSTEKGKELIRKMKASSAIYFCGGEPTLRKDLPELLDYSTKLNMFNMINTNGSLIGDQLTKPRYRNFLMNMDVVIISLDSLTIPQLSDMYKVSDNVSRKVLRNILALKKLQNYVPFKLVANTVITHDNIEECFDILDLCNDLNITFSPVSANIDENPDWELLKKPRYIELIERILERADQGYPMIASGRMLEKLLKFKGLKCYPIVFDHVDYTGEIFWPCKAYKSAKMVNILHYRNLKEAHKAAKKLIDPTNFHGPSDKQCQGDCAWMQDCVCDAYGEALRLGLFDSGILKEMSGLLN
jgi:MoaA/NifB/PqqE/SkfB family radical SAM enzyme